jgi:hypothetical protein
VIFRAGSLSNLYRKEASGAGTEQRVIESANEQYPNDCSRDGRLWLYYEIAAETRGGLVGSAGEAGRQAGSGGFCPSRGSSVSAHALQRRPGAILAGVQPALGGIHADESGRDEVYVQWFPESLGKFQISTGGGFPEWSPDGRELYYVSADGKLMAVD